MTDKLSPELLDELRAYDRDKLQKKYSSVYDYAGGDSPYVKTRKAHDQIFLNLSSPLKLMHQTYLKQASEECYKDKWLQQDNPNIEQINLCRQEQYFKVFGGFLNYLQKSRDSDRLRAEDCFDSAKGDPEESILCLRAYIDGLHTSNGQIEDYFKANHPEYL